jgi:hypothetical protein
MLLQYEVMISMVNAGALRRAVRVTKISTNAMSGYTLRVALNPLNPRPKEEI